MRRLISFMSISLDGYFADEDSGVGWAHRNNDAEWNGFVAGNAGGGGVLVFGRTTYDMMKSYWPTPLAAQQNPEVARHMNERPKLVFSRKLKKVSWNNTTLVKGEIGAQVRKLKKSAGPDLVILGSGSIVAQLAQAGLIDEFQVVVIPVALGAGKAYLGGMKKMLELRRTESRAFGNGNVLLRYAPA